MTRFETQAKVAYLINLDRRPDRWKDFIENSSGLDITITRFAAIDSLKLSASDFRLPPAVAACWLSHQAVARDFLQSAADHCLVLEDDVDLNLESIDALNLLWNQDIHDIDLLQVGYCIHHNRLSNRVVYSRQFLIVEILARLKLLGFSIIRRILKSVYGYEFSYLRGLQEPVAETTFELGTHAYLISRNFADAMISFNNPVHLPADLAMMELVKTEKYRVARLNRSLIAQNNSPSSISNASSNALEIEISKLSAAWTS